MTPEQHGRVREIYEKALPVAGAAREQILDRECAGQAEIRHAVERLLDAHGRVPDWLDRPVLGSAPAPFVKLDGRSIGGYTLVREIGHGGMGCVYLADRTDGTFQKQVAIKLVLPSAASPLMMARFQQEREILASLDHPNIARLLDAGVTEEGWPWFVMELVEGQPIHRWCDQNKLAVSESIQLFQGVLSAVRYAHQRLVVHRDLKPHNILVTDAGVVKLLDFGIAKIVSDEVRSVHTLTMAAMMTPEYASPEQVNGAPVTTLSDVYSLGVILYELLTGHRPYRLLSTAMHEMARVISEQEPTRPSTVLPALAGDVDSILLMALHKEPERRYGSIEAFAADLDSHLHHRPVAAREATPWDRTKRFFRRNPGAVFAGAMVGTSLIAGLSALVWQTRAQLLAARTQAVDGAPFILFAFGVVLVALAFAVYLARPTRRALGGAFVGGALWASALYGNALLSNAMGWWRSRIPDLPEPLVVFGVPIRLSPFTWLAAVLGEMAVLFILAWVWRRWGRKWALVITVVAAAIQFFRERSYYEYVLPGMVYAPGFVALATPVAIYAAGGLLGLFAMRAIAKEK
jgi:hypothetical protein